MRNVSAERQLLGSTFNLRILLRRHKFHRSGGEWLASVRYKLPKLLYTNPGSVTLTEPTFGENST